MDIDRLNKIREICFKKSKSRGATNKRQPQQNNAKPKSPFSRNPNEHKENVEGSRNFDFKNQRLDCTQKVDHLKLMEQGVTMMYEKKQRQLEINVQKFNENMIAKRQRQMKALSEGILGMLHKSMSPSRAAVRREGSPMYVEPGKYASPLSKGMNEYHQLRGMSLNQRDLSPLMKQQEGSSNGQSLNPAGYSLRRIKELLNKFISLAGFPAQVLTSKQVEEMKLRLNGAFDRLLKYQKTIQNPLSLAQDETQQLSNVIEACLCDLELKLKSIALNGGASETELQKVRDFIGTLTEHSAMIDVQEVLSKLMQYIRNIKVSQGLTNIKQTINNSQRLQVNRAFNEMKNFKKDKFRAEKLLKQIFNRTESKQTFGNLTRTFQSWKDNLKVEPVAETVQMLSQYAEFFKEAITSHNIASISTFFDKCKEFISKSFALENPADIDLIFINNKRQAITFIQNETEADQDDRERIIDIEQQSTLKTFISKCEKANNALNYWYQESANTKSKFNQNVDVPYVQRQSAYMMNSQKLDQYFIGLFSTKQTENSLESKSKKLKFIIRVTVKNQKVNQLQNEDFQRKLAYKLHKLEQIMIQSFKVFRKLHYQFKNFNSKLEGMCNSQQSQIMDKAMVNQLQYLQSKSLELSYVQMISECFKLINTTTRELYNYDRVTILQYSQGSINRMNFEQS